MNYPTPCPSAYSLMFACAPKADVPIVFPLYASVKLDGLRLATKWGRTWTRSSKTVPNIFTDSIAKQFEGIDSEFVVGLPNADDVFDVSSSAFRRFSGEPDFKLYVVDSVHHSVKGMKAEQRLNSLYEMVDQYRGLPGGDRLVVHKQRLIHNMGELEEFYETTVTQGFEGLILKRADGLYKNGRSTPSLASQVQLKMKPEDTSEAVAIEFIEGTVNYNPAFLNERGLQERSKHREFLEPSGMVGKIRCRDLYTGVEFNCSPGKMSHDQRKHAWLHRDKLAGTPFSYLFFPVGKQEKPRMNRFFRWRPLADIDGSKVCAAAKEFLA